jgi:Flp pilus assembly protein TadG
MNSVISTVRNRCGTSAVEFALLAPIFAALLLAVADIGMLTLDRIRVQHAAAAGAQEAVLRGFNSDEIAKAGSHATSLAGIRFAPAPVESCGCATGTNILPAACGSTCDSGAAAGRYVTVSTQATHTTLFHWPGMSSSFDLSAQVTVRLE